MSEFTPLREAVDGLSGSRPAPDFDALRGRATRRRRWRVAATVTGAVAFIAVSGGLAVGTLGGDGQSSPTGEPTTSYSESPTTPESAKPTPKSVESLREDLELIVSRIPEWALTELPVPRGYDYALNGPCSGEWKRDATSGGDGGIARFGVGGAGFRTPAQASDAVATLVQNLESCAVTDWRTQPIAQTGAILAFSSEAVTWIRQNGARVDVIQAATTDGPPPVDVQVKVLEWMRAYDEWREAQRD